MNLVPYSQKKGWNNRVIREVRKNTVPEPEFGHTQGEIQKKPAEKYISIQGKGWWGVVKLRKPSI